MLSGYSIKYSIWKSIFSSSTCHVALPVKIISFFSFWKFVELLYYFRLWITVKYLVRLWIPIFFAHNISDHTLPGVSPFEDFHNTQQQCTHTHTYICIHTYTHIHIYGYTYVWLCVCACNIQKKNLYCWNTMTSPSLISQTMVNENNVVIWVSWSLLALQNI